MLWWAIWQYGNIHMQTAFKPCGCDLAALVLKGTFRQLQVTSRLFRLNGTQYTLIIWQCDSRMNYGDGNRLRIFERPSCRQHSYKYINSITRLRKYAWECCFHLLWYQLLSFSVFTQRSFLLVYLAAGKHLKTCHSTPAIKLQSSFNFGILT